LAAALKGKAVVKIGRQSRAYARGLGLGVNPRLELDISQKLYYLRKGD